MAERRRRVLVLNHFAAPRGQAGGTRHVELFSRLDGWEHLIIASDLNPLTGERIQSEGGYAVVPVPTYSTNGIRRIWNWSVYAARAFALGLRQRRVDVVYGSSPHLLAPLAAWMISRVRRVPFVLEVRDLWPRVLVDMGQLSPTSPVFRALTGLENFLYAQAAAIVVMAEGSRVELSSRGVPQAKIHYIPNGADPDDFVASAPRDELRRRFGFTTFTGVYAGAHGPANGLDLLLDAAVAAGRDGLPVEVVLVGGGVEKSRLERRVVDEAIGNVRFMDPVPKVDVPDLLAAADIGLHVLADVELFQSAVSPNKLFDYMAAGLPVLTNCPGNVAGLVARSRCGVATDPGGLGGGLAELFRAGQRDELPDMGRNGRDWIEAHQSRSSMARRLSSLLGAVGRGGR